MLRNITLYFFPLLTMAIRFETEKEQSGHQFRDSYVLFSAGLCIPSNNTIFIKSVSEKLAANEPHLTLEFLEECIQGFRASSIELKHLCLEYMTPWLPNLTR